MSDPLIDLPTKPDDTLGTQSDDASLVCISVSDIKDYISPKLYRELSWDENRTADEVTADCIERAITFMETMLHLVGVEVNHFSKTQKEIAKALTVYELYLYNGDRYKAKSFLDKAERLISDRYKSIEKMHEEKHPAISIAKASG